MDLEPWPNAMIQLKDKTMFIRHARKEEVPKMLGYMEKIMKVEHDFYDIVGVRVYAELLGMFLCSEIGCHITDVETLQENLLKGTVNIRVFFLVPRNSSLVTELRWRLIPATPRRPNSPLPLLPSGPGGVRS